MRGSDARELLRHTASRRIHARGHSERQRRLIARFSFPGDEARCAGLHPLAGGTAPASRLLDAGALVFPCVAATQTVPPLPILTEEATPIGALPPMPLPMPASR